MFGCFDVLSVYNICAGVLDGFVHTCVMKVMYMSEPTIPNAMPGPLSSYITSNAEPTQLPPMLKKKSMY